MKMSRELFDVCTERSPDPDEQRRQILALLKAGADVQASDKNGVTALHHAVRFRSPMAVKTLLEQGADVNRACRKSASTPLHRAVTSTRAPGTAGKKQEAVEIVTILLAAGADPTLRNKQGKTARDYASDETIRQLLAKAKRTRKPKNQTETSR